MIMQIILSFALLFAMLYAIAARRRTRLFGSVLIITVIAGFYFVWFPDQTTLLAHAVGIGRGADLIFYSWILISLIVLLNLHMTIADNRQAMTDIIRHIALQDAQRTVRARARGDKDEATTANGNVP